MSSIEKFLQEIDAFQRRHGITDVGFGRLAMNDGSFVTRLRGGKDGKRGNPTLATVDHIRDWMRQYETQRKSVSV